MGKSKSLISKIIYSVRANLLELIVNVIVTLLVPKFLGNEFEQYGFFQVYLFYIAYIGFFHFGWCDGILLREGGKKYNELDKPLCSSQFQLICLLEIIIAIGISAFTFIFSSSEEYRFVYVMISFNAIVYTPRRILQYYLQSTNRIKEYARITEVGRGIYGILLILIMIFGLHNYELIIIGDVIGKTLALIYSIYVCKDIVFCKPVKLKSGLSEAYNNISVGIKLLFANIASMLITGIVRWGIQMEWDIATYGKISFSLSISNFLLSFISAIAVVLYPTLKRVKTVDLPKYYNSIRDILMVFLFACLLLYYPIQFVLTKWLPQYDTSIKYMAILFPVCIYAAKMSLLVQTYMNIFRLEKKVMIINFIGVALAAVTTFITVFLLKDLTMAMFSIVFNQMFRCIIAEIMVSKLLNLSIIKEIIIETFMVILFILFHWFIGDILGLGLYFIVFVVYLLIHYNSIKSIKKIFNLGK